MTVVRRFYALLTPKARRQSFGVIGLMLGGAALEAMSIGLILPFLALLATPDAVKDYPILELAYSMSGVGDLRSFLIVCGVALAGAFLLKNVYLGFMYYVQYRYVFASQIALSRRLLHHYLTRPYSMHLQRNSAELLRNVNSESIWVFNRVAVPLFTVVIEGLVVVAVVTLLLFIDPVIAVVALVVFVGASVAFYVAVRGRTKRLGDQQQVEMEEMIKWVNQSLGSVKEVILRGAEDYFVDRYIVSSRRYARANRYLNTVVQFPRLFIEVLGACGVLLVVTLVLMRGAVFDTALPVLGVFAVAGIRLMPSLNRIVSALTSIRYSAPSVNAIFADVHGERDEKKRIDTRRNEPIESIRLNRVTFRYPGAEKPALDDVSFEIRGGESVAFVGPSGAGKSTAIDVVLGLLNPQSGEVELNAEPICATLPSWQRRIGYIPQQAYLSDDSVRRNVAFGIDDDAIDDDRVWEVLAQAQLDGSIRDLAGGLDAVVGEHGVKLSGGERQRIAIARALYPEPDVLVLDEATSSLDAETERRFAKALELSSRGKTVIVIAHRMSTVQICDRVFFLMDGRLAATGSYEELLQSNPDFRGLAQGTGSVRQ